MELADGSYALGPERGRLLVRTFRSGAASKAGHDLTIEVTRWHGRATVNTAKPADSAVTVTAEVDSFEVREGTGGIKPLTDGDRAEIKKTLREKILRTGQHPVITFESHQVEGSAESFTITGDLVITGETQPVALHCRADDGKITGSATVVQSRSGIKPYSAFFGALKLRDEVEVSFDVTLRPDH